MPFVQRDGHQIIGAFSNSQLGFAEEWVDADAPDLVAFLDGPGPLDRSISRIQFEFMIEKLGVTDAIAQAIEGMPEGDDKILARVLFRSGQEFFRGHALFTQLAPAVGLTPAQIDDAWIEASELKW